MDEKDELAAVMGIIADSLPESCGNGDVAAVRRVVGTERSRCAHNFVFLCVERLIVFVYPSVCLLHLTQ